MPQLSIGVHTRIVSIFVSHKRASTNVDVLNITTNGNLDGCGIQLDLGFGFLKQHLDNQYHKIVMILVNGEMCVYIMNTDHNHSLKSGQINTVEE